MQDQVTSLNCLKSMEDLRIASQPPPKFQSNILGR